MTDPDAHHPHVVVRTTPVNEAEDVRKWREWCQANASGPFQFRPIQPFNGPIRDYIIYFIKERDATLFKLFLE